MRFIDNEGTTVLDPDGREVDVVDEVIDGTPFVVPMTALDGRARAELGGGGDDRAPIVPTARVKYASASEMGLRNP